MTSHAFFATVNHLSVFGMGDVEFMRNRALFLELSALTHLALFGEYPRTPITEMLAQSSRLRVELLLLLFTTFASSLGVTAITPQIGLRVQKDCGLLLDVVIPPATH
ncbi:hypothetical protein C8R46DRAFT_1228942 [Mycena filopes]|nr:hypothetical protein C8R46DRAFT_1228942 [Mycena filopes]